MNTSATDRRRMKCRMGAVFVLMSLASLVLSLGAPGLGWGLATAAIFAASLCVRLVGQGWLYLCLGITLAHLFTLGPLAGSDGSEFGDDWFFAAFFTAAPFIVGVIALAFAYWRKENKREGMT